MVRFRHWHHSAALQNKNYELSPAFKFDPWIERLILLGFRRQPGTEATSVELRISSIEDFSFRRKIPVLSIPHQGAPRRRDQNVETDENGGKS
jgi:hypothetical protein